jgi:enoyl-CoA hydratase
MELSIDRPQEGTALLRLEAPERRNAFTGDLARELVGALRDLEADPGVGAVVISGGPEAFCAGAHRELLAGVAAGHPDAERDIAAVYAVFAALRSMSTVTVAAVCGPAVGAGLNLALACGLRVLGDNAYLRSMFIANGIHPAGGHLRMLRDVGGRALAVRMAALDEPLDAAAAVATGLGLGPCDPSEAEAYALRTVRRAGGNARLARLINGSVERLESLPVEAAADEEAHLQKQTLTLGADAALRIGS